MKALQENTLVTYVAAVPDPRCEGMCLHKFIDILVIAICAVLCGADTWEGVAKFGRTKKAWFLPFLNSPTEYPPMTPFIELFVYLILKLLRNVLLVG